MTVEATNAASGPPQFERLRLATPRLTLRPLADEDAPGLFGLFSDPQVTRYWSATPWTDLAQARQMIERNRAAMGAGEYVRLALVPRDTGAFVGTCTLFAFSAQCRRAEVGYALASHAWGRGYMHEALVALLDYGFSELDLHRVEADVDPRNAASVRSLERLGFRHEGHLRERWIVAGEVSDTGFYGLLRRDWNDGAAARAAAHHNTGRTGSR